MNEPAHRTMIFFQAGWMLKARSSPVASSSPSMAQ